MKPARVVVRTTRAFFCLEDEMLISAGRSTAGSVDWAAVRAAQSTVR
jgi:hypothetical protein